MFEDHSYCCSRNLFDWRVNQLQGFISKTWKYCDQLLERLKKSENTVIDLQWELKKWLTKDNIGNWSPKIKELEALEKWRWAQLLAALSLMTNEQKAEFDKIDIPDPRTRFDDFKVYLLREHGMRDGP